jgi:hypothetical protein
VRRRRPDEAGSNRGAFLDVHRGKRPGLSKEHLMDERDEARREQGWQQVAGDGSAASVGAEDQGAERVTPAGGENRTADEAGTGEQDDAGIAES